jgi:uncharacterized phiE125 gp8 family phage protein
MALRLITPPAEEPVSLVEAKAHLRVTDPGEDTYISGLITAARMHIDGKDGILGRALVTQTWDLVLDAFPDDILVPLPPLQSVQQITYVDEDGNEQTLAPDQYTVDTVNEPGWIVAGPNGWPKTGDYINAVRVTFTAGYQVVPEPIKIAVRLMIGHWYENREDVVIGVTVMKLPNASEMLLAPYKVYGL